MVEQKEELTEEQMLEKLKKQQVVRREKYLKELDILNKKHNLQVAQIVCPNCQGKGSVLQIVVRQSSNGR